jgi:hypothetical protein
LIDRASAQELISRASSPAAVMAAAACTPALSAGRDRIDGSLLPARLTFLIDLICSAAGHRVDCTDF